MNVAFLAIGVAVVVLTLLDALWTIAWVEGHAAPVAGRVAERANRLLVTVLHRFGHGALSLKGPVLLVFTIGLWTVALWGGWLLVFSASPGAVARSSTGIPADLSDRIYFVGYALSTMGNGDFSPVGDGWQLATGLASLSGMGLLTLLVTYVLSVIEAVVAKRSFASHVVVIGASGEEFVLNSWDGRGFPSLDLQLLSLQEQLNRMTEQHRAYPLVHYFHAASNREASCYAVAVLSEAMLLLGHAVAPEVRPSPVSLRTAQGGVAGFADAIRGTHAEPDGDEPPPPSLRLLRQAGIPLVSEPAYETAVRERSRERRLLLALNRMERREWPTSAATADPT